MEYPTPERRCKRSIWGYPVHLPGVKSYTGSNDYVPTCVPLTAGALFVAAGVSIGMGPLRR